MDIRYLLELFTHVLTEELPKFCTVGLKRVTRRWVKREKLCHNPWACRKITFYTEDESEKNIISDGWELAKEVDRNILLVSTCSSLVSQTGVYFLLLPRL